MKNLFKKMFGQKGFSLPEVMLAVGLMGGMSLLVTHVVKQTDQVKKSTETSTNTFAALYEIQSLVSNKEYCDINFVGKINGDEIPVLRSKSKIPPHETKTHFEVGKTYDGGSVKLVSMVVRRNGNETNIDVAIEKVGNKKANGLNPVIVRKSIPLNAEYDLGNRIVSCAVDVKNHSEEAINSALTKICNGSNLTYDSANKRCFATPQLGEGSGPVTPANTKVVKLCDPGLTLVAVKLVSGIYTTTCEDSTGLSAVNCNDSQILRKDAGTKNYTCMNVSCPGSQVFAGLKDDGLPRCLECNPGDIIVSNAGQAVCGRPDCTTAIKKSYMAGIGSNGAAVCNPLVDDSAGICTTGRLAVRTDGSVAYDCCNPNCSNAANVCSGVSFESSNQCGQCSGTQANVCPNPSNTCAGTTYMGTCGLCQGTRLPVNAQWSEWSECTNGKRTRTCDNAQACGGAACSGNSIEDCGSKTWQCQRADIQLIPGETNYWEAYNVRMEPMDWQQIRPNWPVVKSPGNSWQQGNHQGCVNQCANAAEVRYASSIVMDNGKAVTSDPNMAISIGVTDLFFQAHSNYNTGTPNGTNDNSGWWCACYSKLHAKSATLTFLKPMIQKSGVDSQRENATFCTMNGTMPPGGTPADGPSPVTRIDGGWTAWGPWQACSNNMQYRSRSCTNPAPDAGGANCVGSSSESQACVSVDTCLPATCSSGSKYFYQNSQDFMKVCQMSGASCVSTSAGSTCSHKGKSPYSMCSQTYPGSAGGLSSCTYQGLTYWTSTGCTW